MLFVKKKCLLLLDITGPKWFAFKSKQFINKVYIVNGNIISFHFLNTELYFYKRKCSTMCLSNTHTHIKHNAYINVDGH